MKINKIREMSSPDLEKELGELKSELFKLRFSLATNGLDNPMKIKEVKKDIAKIKTVLTQRELNGGKDVEVKNVVKEAKKAPAKKETASEEPKKEAKKTLEDVGLNIDIKENDNSKDKVESQIPKAGIKTKQGTSVIAYLEE